VNVTDTIILRKFFLDLAIIEGNWINGLVSLIFAVVFISLILNGKIKISIPA